MPNLDILKQLIADVGADTALNLLDIFKDDADKRLAAIADYLENGGDVAHLRVQAHSLKGLCRTYGAPDGGEAAWMLQDACDAGASEADIRALAEAALKIIPVDMAAAIDAAHALHKQT